MKIPKYQLIISELQHQIEQGAFEVGDKFYTESEIAKQYNVSSITAIRALNELAKNGYIVRRQGKGSFISRSRKHKQVAFSDIEKFSFDHDEVFVLSMEEGWEPSILKKLHLSKHQTYYCIERVRKVDGTPYIYHKSYIPSEFIKTDITDLSYYSSIYARFRQDFGLNLANEQAVETNEILFPAPASIAQKLQLLDKEPVVLQIKTTQSSFKQQVYEYVETYKRWDFYKIEFISAL